MDMSNLETPKGPVIMQTSRDVRLSSMSGFVINFKANEPTRVPPQCFQEAIRTGAVEVDVEDRPAEAAPSPDEPVERPGEKEAVKLEVEAKTHHIQTAIKQLLVAGDTTTFNANGYPKPHEVRKLLPAEAGSVTAQDVRDAFDAMTSDMTLAGDSEDSLADI
jgi:hypothetical protein